MRHGHKDSKTMKVKKESGLKHSSVPLYEERSCVPTTELINITTPVY